MEIVLWLELKFWLRDRKLGGQSFPNSLKGGKGKILFPQGSGTINFAGGDFFIGWWESDEE